MEIYQNINNIGKSIRDIFSAVNFVVFSRFYIKCLLF